MATYFSNHSQSRFLANANNAASASSANAQNSNNHISSGSPTTNHSSALGLSQANAGGGKSRLASGSKHFSTIVSASMNASTNEDSKVGRSASAVDGIGMENLSIDVHPLRNTWVFWFRQQRSPGNKIVNYEEGIKRISSFSSVESFWSLWTHLNPPSSLTPTTDYLLFHSGIRRPVWEDPLNITGGKWIIRLRKGVADRFWEDLVLSIIGDQFAEFDDEDGSGQGEMGPEICGCTISVRQHEDIISIWNRVDGDKKDHLREAIRKILNLPPSTIMEYKSNNDSMQDKSSFRTPVERTPAS